MGQNNSKNKDMDGPFTGILFTDGTECSTCITKMKNLGLTDDNITIVNSTTEYGKSMAIQYGITKFPMFVTENRHITLL